MKSHTNTVQSCVQVKATNDPPQITTEEPDFPIIMIVEA